MSCVRLKLPHPRKAWKSFTSKLHRLNPSKHINKRNKRSRQRYDAKTNNPAAKAVIQSSAAFPYQRKRLNLLGYHRGWLFKKKRVAAPVYVDGLFKKHAFEFAAKSSKTSTISVNHVDDEAVAEVKAGANIEEKAGCSSSSSSSAVGDDMWESLTMAPHHMNGIDQRAEEFINRFRAEMQRQEIKARRL